MKQAQVALLIHNARNRLTGILSHLPKDDIQARREVHAAARQLAAAIALLRMGQSQPDIHQEEVDIRLFYHELVVESRFFRPAHLSLATELILPPSHFGVWSFDSQLVMLVILDVLQNAYRSARANVWLTVRCADALSIEVRDDGPGYPEHVRVTGKSEGPSVGTGMGLTLARQIAEMHQVQGNSGHIQLENTPGAAFTLSLP